MDEMLSSKQNGTKVFAPLFPKSGKENIKIYSKQHGGVVREVFAPLFTKSGKENIKVLKTS